MNSALHQAPAGGTGELPEGNIIGARINALSRAEVCELMEQWSRANESRYICIANVHVATMANSDPEFREILNSADIATADGVPLVWVLRKLGFRGQERVDGPTLMLDWCERVQGTKNSIFLYGSSDEILATLQQRLAERFPGLKIAGAISPPFRALTPEEDEAYVQQIAGSGAGVVFVGLGAPKQERWMNEHRGRVPAVMVGVGAAFDFHAGLLQRAPRWMQRAGLEWFYRLLQEPRRLWKRYLVTNTVFVVRVARQFASRRKASGN